MMRTRVLLLALLIGATPASQALAAPLPVVSLFAEQSRRDNDRARDEDRREPQRERIIPARADPGDAARRVSAGREGRMLGIRPAGDGYVVRWEYPGGRVADIRVDGSGRVSGGR